MEQEGGHNNSPGNWFRQTDSMDCAITNIQPRSPGWLAVKVACRLVGGRTQAVTLQSKYTKFHSQCHVTFVMSAGLLQSLPRGLRFETDLTSKGLD